MQSVRPVIAPPIPAPPVQAPHKFTILRKESPQIEVKPIVKRQQPPRQEPVKLK